MKKLLILFGAASLLGGCKKYLNVNKDPNTAEATQSTFVFTNAMARSASGQVGGQHITGATWTGMNAHSTSFSGGGTEKTYNFTNSDFNYWDANFDNLADYQYVINNATKDNVAHLIGPAMVMQAKVFQDLVDMYGDIPYTQALKGVKVLTPVFDDDKFIYEDLIKKLDTAINLIRNMTVTTTGAEDALYVGNGGTGVTAVKFNKTTWVQFANTLKMRILMRQSFMPGRDAYITTEINKILALPAPYNTFIPDNIFINPGYTKSAGKLNPYYVNYGYTETDAQVQNYAYRKVNSVMVNWLKTSKDTFRLQRLAYPAGTTIPSNNLADYVGVNLGAPSGALEANTSSVGPFQIQKGDATRPLIFMTNAEKYFLLAEAAQRYGIAGLGSAQTDYEEGVKWAFRQTTAAWTSTANGSYAQADAASAAYLAQAVNNIGWAASTDKVRAILIQKWVSLMSVNGLESWSEYRKSNTTNASGVVSAFGSVPTSPHSTSGSAAAGEPVRFFYPLREESTNGAQVPQNINVFTSKIFWDVN